MKHKDNKINLLTDLQLFGKLTKEENQGQETQENDENVENKKDFSKNENIDYNNNKEEFKEKSLEEEVNEAKDRKYLASVIVDLKEENTQIKSMLNQILEKLNTKSNNFIDSKINDSNNDDSKYIINI